jgi:hypothetical protein
LEVERLSDHVFSFDNCDMKTISGYRLYILLYVGGATNPRQVERRRLVIGWIDQVIRRVVERGCRVTLKEVEVKDSGRVALTLNDAMMDAYLDDGVDYFFVVLNNTGFASPRKWYSTRNLRHLSTVLRTFTDPVDHGVVAVVESPATGGQLHSMPLAILFSRTHFDIFGLFFPRSLASLRSAVIHLVSLYGKVNLAVSIADDLQTPEVVAVKVLTVEHNGTSKGLRDESSMVVEQALLSDLTTLQRYLSVVTNTTCLRCPSVFRNSSCPTSSTSKRQHIISMSLYGSSRRYTMGAIRNAQLVPVIYPGWQLPFYIEPPPFAAASDGSGYRYGRVPDGILRRLAELGAELLYVNLTVSGGGGRTLAPMMWRFTVVDDESVDVFIVRDCDSRLTSRDAAVVADWLRQPPATSVFHCVRDHPSHSGFSVSGGLWGGRRRALAELFNGSFSAAMIKYSSRYMEDMHFLGRDVWSRVQSVAFCHDSFSCTRYPSSHPFPVQRIGTEHLGQVYDQFSIGRQSDIDVIVSARISADCVPSPTSRLNAPKS